MSHCFSSIVHLCSLSNLAVDDRKVKGKALELSKLLEVRMSSTSLSALRLVGLCQHIICIDLAAKALGYTLNKRDVIRLSGMNQRSYNEARDVIASVLEVEDHMTLSELAAKLGCPGAVILAAEVLHKYIADQCSDVDFYSPMFLCAALTVACRKLSIRTSNSRKIRELGGVKPTTLATLIKQMEKYTTEMKADRRLQNTPSKKRVGLLATVETMFQEEDENSKRRKMGDETCQKEDVSEVKASPEDYETWKQKILARASQSQS